MALLAIFGPHAIGKTTAMYRLVDRLKPTDFPVTVVSADMSKEMHWGDGELIVQKNDAWKDIQDKKKWCYLDAIMDDYRIWVSESVRPDVWKWLVQGHKECGGVCVMYLWAKPEVFRKFVIDRNEANGTQYNQLYWDDFTRLSYEGYGRMHNQAVKYLKPQRVPYDFIEVSYDRHEWPEIDNRIWRIVTTPLEDWYR